MTGTESLGKLEYREHTWRPGTVFQRGRREPPLACQNQLAVGM